MTETITARVGDVAAMTRGAEQANALARAVDGQKCANAPEAGAQTPMGAAETLAKRQRDAQRQPQRSALLALRPYRRARAHQLHATSKHSLEGAARTKMSLEYAGSTHLQFAKPAAPKTRHVCRMSSGTATRECVSCRPRARMRPVSQRRRGNLE